MIKFYIQGRRKEEDKESVLVTTLVTAYTDLSFSCGWWAKVDQHF